jgi:hypothetical protein
MCCRAWLAGVLVCWLAGGASAQEPARPVRFQDDFRTDTRKDYQVVQGEATWQKGRLTLAEGTLLRRPLDLGSVAEVRAVVRLDRGQSEGGVAFFLTCDSPSPGAGPPAAGGILNLQAGKPSLVLSASSREVFPLTVPARPGATEERAWVVRLGLHHGLARVKAWPQGTPEPKDWQLQRPAAGTRQQPGWRWGRGVTPAAASSTWP